MLWRSALLFIRIFRFSVGLAFPLGKVTVILLHNALHFSERPHKCLHIGITVLFQNVGQLIRFCGDFLFRPLYLLRRGFPLFAFEYPFCIRNAPWCVLRPKAYRTAAGGFPGPYR